jgi:hypothetical protein
MMAFLSRISRVIRDLCIGIMGVLALTDAPPSISAGLSEHLPVLWSLLLIVGAAVSLVGSAMKRPLVEVTGCIIAGAAFLTWAVAAVTTGPTTTTSWVIFWLLIAGVAGQVYRAAEVTNDARPIDWTGDC